MPSSAVGFNFSAGGSVVVVLAGSLGCAVIVVVVVVVAGADVTVGLDDTAEVMAVGLGVAVAGGAVTGAGAEGVTVAVVVVVVLSEAAAPNDVDEPKPGVAAGDLAPGTVFFASKPKPPDPRVDVDPNALAAGAFIVDVEPNKDGVALAALAEGAVAPGVVLLGNKEEGIVLDGDWAPGTVFFASEPKPPLPNVLVDPKADTGAAVVVVAGLGASGFFSSFVLKEPNESDDTSGSVFDKASESFGAVLAAAAAAGAGVWVGAPNAPVVEEPKNGEVLLLVEPKLEVVPKDEVVVLLADAPKLDVEPKAGVSLLLAAPKLVVDPNKGLLVSLFAVVVVVVAAEPKPLEVPNAGAAVELAVELPKFAGEIFGADPRLEKDGILPPVVAAPKPPNPPKPPPVVAAGVGLLPDKRSANELSLFDVEAEPNAEKPEGAAEGVAAAGTVAAGVAVAADAADDSFL